LRGSAKSVTVRLLMGWGVITETTVTDETDGGTKASGFQLLVMSAEGFASHALPSGGAISIGRSSKCVVRLDDPMASREHALLHIDCVGGVASLRVEDSGSANGTRVRDDLIPAGESRSVEAGEGVIIGSTVIMVLRDRPSSGLWRLWSHVYFGARMEEECARAAKAKATFALARLRFIGSAPSAKVLPTLARVLTSAFGVALYGPKDYEALFLGVNEDDANALMNGLVEAFQRDGLDVRGALAWYPRDGRTGDALMASANSSLKGRPASASVPEIGSPESADMRRVRDMAARVATSQINVMIRGETGVGKDVLARTIHRLSTRAGHPFLALNCAGFPEALLESELFGHEKGTFTGAHAVKKGLLESADGGTVFLDELGDMPLVVQGKLLRVIEDREVRRMGALQTRPINVRFLSATNKDLEDAIDRGSFRKDLMFRLQGISLEIPPLRQRRDEIALLAETFLDDACREAKLFPKPTIGRDAMTAMLQYEWEGNIRELKNVIERSVALCRGDEIGAEHLDLRQNFAPPAVLPLLTDGGEKAERQRIVKALAACAGSQTRAAKLLGMSRRTLISKIELYGIPRPQKQGANPPLDKKPPIDGPALVRATKRAEERTPGS
jgi:two-component system response regulator AtoC